MVSDTLCPAVKNLGTKNMYSRVKGIADHYWPQAVFFPYLIVLRVYYAHVCILQETVGSGREEKHNFVGSSLLVVRSYTYGRTVVYVRSFTPFCVKLPSYSLLVFTFNTFCR